MSWLTDVQEQNKSLKIVDPQSTFIQNSNVDLGESSESSESSEVPETSKSWLTTVKDQVKEETDRETGFQKGMRWLKEDSFSDTVDVFAGAHEATTQLLWGALSFEASIAAGTARMSYEKARNLVVGDKRKRSPEKVLEKVQDTQHWLPGLLPPPKTQLAKSVLEPVGDVFHWLFTGPRKIGKDMTKFYGPNAGWLSEQILTLGMCRLGHIGGKELSGKIGGMIKDAKGAKAKKVAAELDAILKEAQGSKTPSKYDTAFQKKVNEYEAILQAEWELETAKYEAGLKTSELASADPGYVKSGKPPKLPKIPKGRIIEFAEAAKETPELSLAEKPTPIKMTLDTINKAKKRRENLIKNSIHKEAPVMTEKVTSTDSGYTKSNRPLKLHKIPKKPTKEFIEPVKETPKLSPVEKPKAVKMTLDTLNKAKKRRGGSVKEPILTETQAMLKRIPKFEDTIEAYKYAESVTKEQMKDIELYRELSLKKVKDLKAAGDISGAFLESQHSQLYREVIERYNNEGSAKREVSKPLDKTPAKPEIAKAEIKLSERAQVEQEANLETAQDMGIYDNIKELLGKKKTSREILTELKKGEFFEADLEDFKLTKRDVVSAIQAVRIAEFKDPKAVKYLEASIKKEAEKVEKLKETKKSAKKDRVNPETGRAPGVPTLKRKFDLGTSEILETYKARQKPLTSSEGKIIKTRSIAEKNARDQGLMGELVRDSSGKGWIVKSTEKITKPSNNELQKLQETWDNILDKDLKKESASKESYDATTWDGLLDLIKSEKGSVKIDSAAVKKTIKKILWNEKGSMRPDAFTLPATETIKLLKRVEKRLEKTKYIRNFNHNEKQLVEELMYMHTKGKFDLDVTYGKGGIEKRVGFSPKHKMDKFPQTEDTLAGDITNRKSIPFEDNSMNSILYDPHYLVSPTGIKSKGIIVNRFGASQSLNHLWQMLDLASENLFALLKPGGKLVVKIQDATYHKTIQSTNEMYNFLVRSGFKPTDKFYYQPKRYLPISKKALAGTQKHAKKIVTEFQVYVKPKKYYKHPSTSLLSKNYKKPTSIEEPIINNVLKSIIKSERGAITIDPVDFKKAADFLKTKGMSTKNAIKLLKARGISDELIIGYYKKDGKSFIQNLNKEPVESQWLKKGQNPEQLLPARNLSKGKKAPAVSRGDAKIIEEAPDIGRPLFGEKIRHMATSEGLMTSLGKPIRDTFLRRAMKGEKQSSDIQKTLLMESQKLRKTLPFWKRVKSSKRIDNYAISRQKNGADRLEAMGEKIVTELSPAEMKIYNRMQEVYKDLYVKINKVRKASGQKEFPAVKNYSTWIHDLSKLNELEKVSMFGRLESIQKGLRAIQKLPSQMDKTGRAPSMKGHEKFRGGSDTPGYLKLDAFENFNQYVMMAGDVLGKTEPLAYLHELLQPKFELYKNAPNTYNFLREWLDYQKGSTPEMFITNPKTKRTMAKLSGNVAVSYITYAPRSVLVQFSSLNNSIAEIGMPKMVQGITKSLNPGELKRAARVSNALTVRTPETAITDALVGTPTFPGNVGKQIHKAGKAVKKVGIIPLSIADNIVSYSTWLGAEALGRSKFKKSAEYKKLSGKKAVKALDKYGIDFADDVVIRAQGSAAKSARAPIQRTAEGKFITTLQTFTIANFDYLTRHILGIKNPDITKPEQVAKTMQWVATSALISQGFDQVGWRSPIPTPIKAYQESMEQTKDKVKAIKNASTEILEFIPIYGGKYKFGSELSGAVIDQLVKLGKGDMTALPRLMGTPGFSTILKGYRAYDRNGTAADILMGRYIKKPKSSRSGGLSGF